MLEDVALRNKGKFTSHFNFWHERDSLKEGNYMSEYFTTEEPEEGTFIRVQDVNGKGVAVYKIADAQIKIIEAFTLFLDDEETKPYYAFHIVKGDRETFCSAPAWLLRTHCEKTRRYEKAGGVISEQAGRAILFAGKIAQRIGLIPFIRRKNLTSDFKKPEGATSFYDFRNLGQTLTAFWTTDKGTFAAEIDADGTEREKQISNSQIHLEDPTEFEGWHGCLAMDIVNKYNEKTRVEVPYVSLLDMPNGLHLDDYRKAGGTCDRLTGICIYKAVNLKQKLRYFDETEIDDF